MFPVFLNLKGRIAVVIGGGAVGRRKAANMLAAGARVCLVCLEPRPADETHADLDWRTAPYALEHLQGASIVFAAATADVNAQVVADAQARGLWVNAATDPQAGNFLVPAVIRRGDFVVAISTGGASPALAQSIRQQLAEQFDDSFDKWVSLLAEMRPLVLVRIASEEQRRMLFERWSQPVWLERLRHEGVNALRLALHARHGKRLAKPSSTMNP
jgi:precorrin-2 dehydrogenase / sirohydrochlorin ferrochelatase